MPTIVFFLVPMEPLSHHMIRQARSGDTVFVSSREIPGRAQSTKKHSCGGWGESGKDDRKQK
jgi:hypothetical protein